MRLLAFVAAFIFSVAACAEGAKAPAKVDHHYREGVEYTLLNSPVPTITGDKIEVAEIFRYGCGHCYAFESVLGPWKKTLADDVAFVETPVVWNKPTEVRARIYFTAQALGVADKVHLKIFQAIHESPKGQKSLLKEDDIADLFESVGVERTKFKQMFNNFMVTAKVNQSDARARSFQVSGTPEIVVDGRYRVTATSAGSHKKMLEVVDYLTAKIRADKAK